MPNIRFHFDTDVATFDRGDILEWLRDCDNLDEVPLDGLCRMSDAELVALLSENDIEEFYDNMVGNGPVCIRCEVVEDEVAPSEVADD